MLMPLLYVNPMLPPSVIMAPANVENPTGDNASLAGVHSPATDGYLIGGDRPGVTNSHRVSGEP
jgi:hypothetical protein